MVSALLIKHPANEGNPTCAGTSPPSKAAARESISGIDIFLADENNLRSGELSVVRIVRRRR
eukprot:scaffold9517_cov39-Phaeocystis_antarctica.AAC.1